MPARALWCCMSMRECHVYACRDVNVRIFFFRSEHKRHWIPNKMYDSNERRKKNERKKEKKVNKNGEKKTRKTVKRNSRRRQRRRKKIKIVLRNVYAMATDDRAVAAVQVLFQFIHSPSRPLINVCILYVNRWKMKMSFRTARCRVFPLKKKIFHFRIVGVVGGGDGGGGNLLALHQTVHTLSPCSLT